jgi:hypothetical protein
LILGELPIGRKSTCDVRCITTVRTSHIEQTRKKLGLLGISYKQIRLHVKDSLL